MLPLKFSLQKEHLQGISIRQSFQVSDTGCQQRVCVPSYKHRLSTDHRICSDSQDLNYLQPLADRNSFWCHWSTQKRMERTRKTFHRLKESFLWFEEERLDGEWAKKKIYQPICRLRFTQKRPGRAWKIYWLLMEIVLWLKAEKSWRDWKTCS